MRSQAHVYDEFGQEIAASPVRDKGTKAKKLLTQIDKPGVYFATARVTSHVEGDLRAQHRRLVNVASARVVVT